MPVAHHLAQARFDVQQRGGQPAVSLARLLPVVDLRTALLDERIDRLEGSVTSRRGTGMLLDMSCCLSMNCQRPRVERSGSKAAILPGA